jgi:predicted DNA-binding transcriptional regulator AlpA
MREAFGCGDTQIDLLERQGVVPPRFHLWPGSRAVGWDLDEVVAAQQRIEAARAEAEMKKKESETAPAPEKVDPPRPKSALLNRPRPKAVRR